MSIHMNGVKKFPAAYWVFGYDDPATTLKESLDLLGDILHVLYLGDSAEEDDPVKAANRQVTEREVPLEDGFRTSYTIKKFLGRVYGGQFAC